MSPRRGHSNSCFVVECMSIFNSRRTKDMAVTSGFGILEISPVVSVEEFVKNNLKVVTPGGAQ